MHTEAQGENHRYTQGHKARITDTHRDTEIITETHRDTERGAQIHTQGHRETQIQRGTQR